MKRFPHVLGLALIPEWRLPKLPFADHLSAVFQQYNIDCVLDVGANDGGYRDFLRLHVGYQGPIVSFEPIPAVASDLRLRSQGDPNWKVVEIALGNEDGERPFHVMEGTQFSSFLSPDNSATPHLQSKNRVSSTLDVRVARLQSVFADVTAGFKARNCFLKLDTQGSDLDVLKGSVGMLDQVRAIQTELSMIPIYKGMPGFQVMLAALDEFGFCISNMFPVTLDKALRAIEFDCVLLKRQV